MSDICVDTTSIESAISATNNDINLLNQAVSEILKTISFYRSYNNCPAYDDLADMATIVCKTLEDNMDNLSLLNKHLDALSSDVDDYLSCRW